MKMLGDAGKDAPQYQTVLDRKIQCVQHSETTHDGWRQSQTVTEVLWQPEPLLRAPMCSAPGSPFLLLSQSHGEADGARIPQWKLIALLLVSFSGRALVCSHHPVINTRMSNWPCGGTLWGSREEWQDCAFGWHCGFLLEWSSCVTIAWEVSSKGLSRNQQSILRFYFQRGDGV